MWDSTVRQNFLLAAINISKHLPFMINGTRSKRLEVETRRTLERDRAYS